MLTWPFREKDQKNYRCKKMDRQKGRDQSRPWVSGLRLFIRRRFNRGKGKGHPPPLEMSVAPMCFLHGKTSNISISKTSKRKFQSDHSVCLVKLEMISND